MFSRRSIMSAVVCLPLLAFAIAACSTTQLQTMNQVATDANIIATGLKNALPQLAAIQGMPAAELAKAGVVIADIQTVAATIGAASSASAALPSVQQLEVLVNTLVSTLAQFPLPPAVQTTLQAAAVLLPVIEIAVGLAATPTASSMSPAEARLILSGV